MQDPEKGSFSRHFVAPRREAMSRPAALRLPLFGAGLALALSGACGAGAFPAQVGPTVRDTLSLEERSLLLRDVEILSHDSMEGRRAGTEGIARARRFLVEQFAARGLTAVGGRTIQAFELATGGGVESLGTNVMGAVTGTEIPDRFIVVTAHYDHLGIRDGEIYNGADDNASGTAALLALASRFSRSPLRHSLIFVAFDGEEVGLRGARAFVSSPPVPLDSVVLNVNLDMVSRSRAGELYAAGTYHYPYLAELVAEVADRGAVTVLTGHDRPGLPPGDDWTTASDHGPFHEAGVPFLYFGVEDHDGYHRPSDTFENITPEFYMSAVEVILDFIRVADGRGEAILAHRTGGATR
jgi:hypothetical protein